MAESKPALSNREVYYDGELFHHDGEFYYDPGGCEYDLEDLKERKELNDRIRAQILAHP